MAWGNNTYGTLATSTGCPYAPQIPIGLPPMATLASGGPNTVALDRDGSVWTWGTLDNWPVEPTITVPQRLPWTGVSALAAGFSHSLALKTDGTVLAWGINRYGQLGTPVDRAPAGTPVPVPRLEGIRAIACGATHSLAVREDGSVFCWGDNYGGGAGTGYSVATRTIFSPILRAGLPSVTAVSGGSWFSLALDKEGAVWAWGIGDRGQLGDGTRRGSVQPVQVSGLTGVVAIAAGDNRSIALKSDGTVWWWGYGSSSSVNPGHQLAPARIEGLSGVVAISAGFMALKGDGSAWMFDGPGAPILLKGLPAVAGVAGGPIHTGSGRACFVILVDGGVRGYGMNCDGELGNGKSGYGGRGSVSPIPVATVPGLQSLAGGSQSDHYLALGEGGSVWGWGFNECGGLGNGTSENTFRPTRAQGVTNAVGLAVGGGHSLAVLADGTVMAWGANWYGQLGTTSANQPVPVQVAGLSRIRSVAAGFSHSLALDEQGVAWSWGTPWSPLDIPVANPAPARVNGLPPCSALAGGASHSLALARDGTVWAWGGNTYGGVGTTTFSYNATHAWSETIISTPWQVPGLTDVVAIAAGDQTSYALRRDGTLWSWGENSWGQLGWGTSGDYLPQNCRPGQVYGLAGVKAVQAGQLHALALKEDGTVWAWGNNWDGQRGAGETWGGNSAAETPQNPGLATQVPGLTGVKGIAASSWSCLAFFP